MGTCCKSSNQVLHTLKKEQATMSWQEYVDVQLIGTKAVSKAVICGLDGNIWATSSGFNVTAPELKTMHDKFNDTAQLASSGVTIGGVKYMFLSKTDTVVRGKKAGLGGLHAVKCKQCYIVCVYLEEANQVAESAASVAEKLGDY